MSASAKPVSRPGILLGIEEPVAHRLTCEIQRFSPLASVAATASFLDLQKRSVASQPAVILLEFKLLEGRPLVESVLQLTRTGHVILVAPFERQTEIAALVASGNVDFVARFGDFVPLAASLIERWILKPPSGESYIHRFGPPFPDNLGEIFRHEINNPLTGILGNAELLLAHRDRLPAGDTQRLQTVVDLAVRLRETIRCLSNSWEIKSHSAKSA